MSIPIDKKFNPQWKDGLPKEIEKAIRTKLAPKDSDKETLKKYKILVEYVNVPSVRDDILELENEDPLRPKVFSVGVLLCKENQNEDQQFQNNTTSPVFEKFLNFLGDKIPLQGFSGYRGDLDVKTATTGTHSIYRRWKGFEFMFHVSTYLPLVNGPEGHLPRKRRIGNDIGTIIFQENGVYHPGIRSQFLQCYWVVSPITQNGETKYKFETTTTDRVPLFGPENAVQPFSANYDFRDLLFSKIVNGLLASLQSPGLREKLWVAPKQMYLTELIKKYTKSKSILQSLEEK